MKLELLFFIIFIVFILILLRVLYKIKWSSVSLSKLNSRADSTTVKTINVLDPQYGIVLNGSEITAKLYDLLKKYSGPDYNILFPPGTYVVKNLYIPSNCTLTFQKGAKMVGINNAPEWSRVVKITGENIKIYGDLEIDGRSKTITNGNEHMAGLFIFDAKNVYIQRVNSHDCYGDNVFIGGTSETIYAQNITIGNITAATAGRKNLVIHYVDQLKISRAVLDNRKGNIDFLGSNSLDVEPDDYTGVKSFYQRIDKIITYGTGNDFTVGTTADKADKWITDIGTFEIHLMQNKGSGLLAYGITLKIENLFVYLNGKTLGIDSLYATRIQIKKAYFYNGTQNIIVMKQNGDRRPKIQIDYLYVKSPNSNGIINWGGDLLIKQYYIRGLKDLALDVFATRSHQNIISYVDSENSCASALVNLATYEHHAYSTVFDHIYIKDTRSNKIDYIFIVRDKESLQSLQTNRFTNPNNIPKLLYTGSDAPTLKTLLNKYLTRDE